MQSSSRGKGSQAVAKRAKRPPVRSHTRVNVAGFLFRTPDRQTRTKKKRPWQAVASARGPGPHGGAPGEARLISRGLMVVLRNGARVGPQMGLPDSCVRRKGAPVPAPRPRWRRQTRNDQCTPHGTFGLAKLATCLPAVLVFVCPASGADPRPKSSRSAGGSALSLSEKNGAIRACASSFRQQQPAASKTALASDGPRAPSRRPEGFRTNTTTPTSMPRAPAPPERPNQT